MPMLLAVSAISARIVNSFFIDPFLGTPASVVFVVGQAWPVLISTRLYCKRMTQGKALRRAKVYAEQADIQQGNRHE